MKSPEVILESDCTVVVTVADLRMSAVEGYTRSVIDRPSGTTLETLHEL